MNKSEYYIKMIVQSERLEGIEAIREAIDPKMSRRTFYRCWRWRIAPILMEYSRWWERNPPIRYFTFRRLLYRIMLETYKI
jgi:hypothetical protein